MNNMSQTEKEKEAELEALLKLQSAKTKEVEEILKEGYAGIAEIRNNATDILRVARSLRTLNTEEYDKEARIYEQQADAFSEQADKEELRLKSIENELNSHKPTKETEADSE